MSHSIALTEAETKVLNAVIDEMKDIPDVDFEVVAQKVGIKYAKNAKQSFKKVWAKMKSGNGAAATDGGDAEEANGDTDGESSKKPTAKKATGPKKAPAAKKGVAKATGPKKVSDGVPKAAKAPRKSNRQKVEEVAAVATAAETPEQHENEEEDMEEDNEDGKSLKLTTSATVVEPVKCVTPAEPFNSNRNPATTGGDEISGLAQVETVLVTEGEVALAADEAPSLTNGASYIMDDEYEARLREMPLEAWLKWKAESGYTSDLLSV